MRYQLQMLEIERHDRPSNSSIDGKIKKITKKFIGYINSDFLQQIGNIIRLKYNEERNIEHKDYIITKVIHIVNEGYEDECVLEVQMYNNQKLYQNGSSSWFEFIPLVIDIE